MNEAIFFNIQHFSLHDGPGIRTTVFLKGCNLRCQWCHNPESWERAPSVTFAAEKCIGCRKCTAVCKNGAHIFDREGRHFLDRSVCAGEGACVAVCNACALEICGYCKPVDEVVKEALRDRQLYARTGGGVTFSGGEPLLQAGFVREAAKRLKEQGVHVAVDTAACVPWERFETCLPFVDLFLVDVKLFDEKKHIEYTGVSNARIFENIKKLARKKPMYIRIPLVGGVNDTAEEMEPIADFLTTLGENVLQIELLTYHALGIAKSALLGMQAKPFKAPAKEKMQALAALFSRTDKPVLIA